MRCLTVGHHIIKFMVPFGALKQTLAFCVCKHGMLYCVSMATSSVWTIREHVALYLVFHPYDKEFSILSMSLVLYFMKTVGLTCFTVSMMSLPHGQDDNCGRPNLCVMAVIALPSSYWTIILNFTSRSITAFFSQARLLSGLNLHGILS